MNRDPTAVNELPDGYEFSTVQLGTAGSRWETWRTNLIYSEVIIQHLSTTQGYWAGNTYGLTPAYASSFFEASYYGGVNSTPWLASVKNVENLLAELVGNPGANVNHLAATRIWRALIYQRLTDIYGDIPYFEAAQGYLAGEFTPWYTRQDSIYMDLHQELTEAVDQFDPSQGANDAFGNADLVFGGDIQNWQRFANSLRLRLALRLVKVRPDLARQWTEEAVNHPAGVMQSNEGMAVMLHQAGPLGWSGGLQYARQQRSRGCGVEAPAQQGARGLHEGARPPPAARLRHTHQ